MVTAFIKFSLYGDIDIEDIEQLNKLLIFNYNWAQGASHVA